MKNVYFGRILFYLCLIELSYQEEAKCPVQFGTKAFGDECKFVCHCRNATEQCNEITGSCASGCSNGWMGPGCQYSNIAPGAKPKMSKNHKKRYAKYAIDNNVTSCSDTGDISNNPPWWRVTLQKHRYIERIQFITKKEYLGEFNKFIVTVGNVSWTHRNNKTINPGGSACYRHGDRSIRSSTVDITCGPPLFGNQIKLSLSKATSRLVLCEFRISGGRNIAVNRKTESSTLDTNTFCDSETCAVDGVISKEPKRCTGLVSWEKQTFSIALGNTFQLQGFTITSLDGRGSLFGLRISREQSHKKRAVTLVSNNTHIFENFFSPLKIQVFNLSRNKEDARSCKEQRLVLCEVQIWGDCVPNFCGFECTKQCFCESWETMSLEDRQLGICQHGCRLGWTGNNRTCNQECVDGTYGQDCEKKCSKNCRDGLPCNKTNGHCSEGCEVGWTGLQCNQTCSPGKYGLNCKLSCSENCHDIKSCYSTDGKCINGCKAGWKGDYCNDQCNAGKYGIHCASNCSGNCYKEPCRRTDGTCYNHCKDGWKGDQCDQACEPSTFGMDCQTNCSSNCVNGSCRHTDGQCVHRCRIGWEGERCDQAIAVEVSPTSSKTVVSADLSVVGISVGVVVFVIALVLVVIVIIKKRRKETRESSVESSRIYRSPRQKQPVQSENEDHVASGVVNQAIEIQEITEQRHQDADRNIHCVDKPVAIDNTVEHSVYANLGPQKDLHDINIKDLKTFIETTRLDDLYAEFERLPRGLQFPTEAALQETNRPKNRYKEMYPYDHCRVVLSKQPNDPYTDYINASFINGFHGTKSYIASAAPIDSSINDFWRMIWETYIKTIVMVTHLEEAEKVKCLKYWPNISETAEYGELKVNTIRVDALADFTVRTLLVTKTGSQQHEITHYHYTAWPDKDVPDGCTGMIHFLQYIRTRDQTRHYPWLVHCSAGIGRTGTFIALDHLYTEGQRTGTVNIYQCVYDLREQRVNCVQTREQYRFIHEMLFEIFSAPTSPTSVDVYMDRYGQVNDLDPVSNLTNLELHYQSLAALMRGGKWRDNQQNNSEANPKSLNVILAGYGKEKSRKIENAYFIPSYHCQKGNIVSIFSQENSHLLLKLTVQEKIELVISLDFPSHIDNEESLNWFPQIGQRKIGPVSVKLQSELVQNTHTEKIYEMKQAKEFQDTKVVGFKCWPPDRPCPSSIESMRNLIDTVRMMRGNSRKSLLVLSLDSFAKCGMFCILLSMVDRVFAENEICIFQTIRHYQSRNPDIAITYEQFKFCHDFIKLYLQKENTYVNDK